MIDRDELRRCNILLYTPNGDYISVESIGTYWINGFDGNEGDLYEYLSGIPLTEEILLKCGFEKTSGYSVFKLEISDDITIVVNIHDGDSYLLNFGDRININTPVKAIHELQNIYYWLSGKKELEMKL